jgi:hypothetical protein
MLESSEISANHGHVWSAVQVAFQRWLALPRKEREPRTQAELGKELGVGVVTMWKWKHLPGWEDAVRALVEAALFDSPTVQQRVLNALVRKAEEGSFYHQRLYLELAGIYNPKGTVAQAGVKVVFGVGEEEI